MLWFLVEEKRAGLRGSTERFERDGVQNQQAGGERAAAANDALICPESPDDERGKGVHFID